MAIDFPNSPTAGDTFTTAGRTYRYNGTAWQAILAAPLQSGTTVLDTPGNYTGTMTVSTLLAYDETLTGTELCATTADIRITITDYDEGMVMGPWNKNVSALGAATVSALAALPPGAYMTAGETTTPASTSSYVYDGKKKYDDSADIEYYVYPLPVGPLVDYEESLTAGVYLRIQYTTWEITPSIVDFQTLWDTGLYDIVFNGSSITTPHTLSVVAGVVTLTCYGPTFTTGQPIELRLRKQPLVSFTRDDGSPVSLTTDRTGGFEVADSRGRVRIGHAGTDHFEDAILFEIENTVDDEYIGAAITTYGSGGSSSPDLWFRRAASAPGATLGNTGSAPIGNIYFAGVTNNRWQPEWKIEVGESYFSITDLDTNIDHLRLGQTWLTWNPTLGGTGWAIGNGTISARYVRVGRLVTASIYVAFGSTSTYGAGEPVLTAFPTGAVSANAMQLVNVTLVDTSASNTYLGMASAALSSTSGSCSITPKSIGTNGLRTPLSNTAPFTWASGDIWRIWFQYEASS